MKDTDKTREQLIQEMAGMRRRIAELEVLEAEHRQVEVALQAREGQLRLIIDSVPAYIAYVGLDDLHYQYVNSRFEEGFGIPRDNIIGKHIRAIIGESNYEFALKYIEVVRSGQAAAYENAFTL
jgi:PAS domain-containing protein